MPSPTEPLKLNEVGAYGDLMARPNPDGLVVVTVPPFETMLPFIARQRGRELTPDEVEAEEFGGTLYLIRGWWLTLGRALGKVGLWRD